MRDRAININTQIKISLGTRDIGRKLKIHWDFQPVLVRVVLADLTGFYGRSLECKSFL